MHILHSSQISQIYLQSTTYMYMYTIGCALYVDTCTVDCVLVDTCIIIICIYMCMDMYNRLCTFNSYPLRLLPTAKITKSSGNIKKNLSSTSQIVFTHMCMYNIRHNFTLYIYNVHENVHNTYTYNYLYTYVHMYIQTCAYLNV